MRSKNLLFVTISENVEEIYLQKQYKLEISEKVMHK